VLGRFARGDGYSASQVWQVEFGSSMFMTHNGAASSIGAGCLLLATGS
jgi:hypothetical protein